MAARDPRSWLTKYISLQQRFDREIFRALQRANTDAEARIRALRGRVNISSVVETAQLRQAQIELHRVMATLYDAIGDTTRRGQEEAAALAVEQGWSWDQILLTRVFLTAAEREVMHRSLQQTASRGVEAAIARMTGTQIPLSTRVYRSRTLSSGLLDARINSALARGISWSQFATEVRTSIRPDAPGGVAYAAKRLARTEINNAYHAMSVETNKDKPWNTGMVWKTSGSHPEPDLCDLYEDRSPYPLGEVPRKPHPQCLCYTYPETVSPEEFMRQYRAGSYDSYINATYGTNGRRVA